MIFLVDADEIVSELAGRLLEKVFEHLPRARLSTCLLETGCPKTLSYDEARSWLIARASVHLLCDTPALRKQVGLSRQSSSPPDGFAAGAYYTDIVARDGGLVHDAAGAHRMLQDVFEGTRLRIELERAGGESGPIDRNEFLHDMMRMTCTGVGAKRIIHAVGDEDRGRVEEVVARCADHIALSDISDSYILRSKCEIAALGTTIWELTAYASYVSAHLNARVVFDEAEEDVVHVTPIRWAQTEIDLHEQIVRTLGDVPVEIGKGGFRIDLSGRDVAGNEIARLLGVAMRVLLIPCLGILPIVLALFVLPCCTHVEHAPQHQAVMHDGVRDDWEDWGGIEYDPRYGFEIGTPNEAAPIYMVYRTNTGAYYYANMQRGTYHAHTTVQTLDELALTLVQIKHAAHAECGGIRVMNIAYDEDAGFSKDEFADLQGAIEKILDRLPRDPELLNFETEWRFDIHG